VHKCYNFAFVKVYYTVRIKTILSTILLALCIAACKPCQTRSDYFVGTNFWYGPILASDGRGGDYARLTAELDSLKSIGITNLRVLAGADGPDGVDVKVSPVLHTAPGEYDEALLAGLDKFLKELEKRDMKAVLYLNNSWEWSGGYGTYLEWAGEGITPNTRTDGYGAYMQFVSKFITSEKAQELYFDHVRFMVERFKDSDAIYSWQIGNEPRCFSDDPAARDSFIEFLTKSAKLIKSIDPKHMVSTGNEGKMGCEADFELFRRVASIEDVDYITIHIWPYNWGWAHKESLAEDLPTAIANSDIYIDESMKLAEKLGKKITIEEFGFPRDGFQFTKGTPTSARDAYYSHIFDRVIASAREEGALLGCNFWGWGGLAEQTPGHIYWEQGDDYCGDPSQEEQGLNSVYMSDASTINIIRKANETLSNLVSAKVVMEHDWLFTDSEPYIRLDLCSPQSSSTSVEVAFVRDTTLMGQADTAHVDRQVYSLKASEAITTKFFAPLEPGFYQVRISVDGKNLHTFNIGVRPEDIVSEQSKQPDFDEFWEANLAELAAVPMKPVLTLIPEATTAELNVYRVEMEGIGGARIGGILAEPVKEGKYPAYIEYMGYGADVYNYWGGDNPEAIQFLVSVRDQGIFRDNERRYIDRGLASKEDFYYRGAFCDAVRAVDFVCSRPSCDSTRVFALGESQGGAFTWIAAALDHRIRAIAPAVPFLSDFEDYAKIVWWPMWEVYEQAESESIGREALMTTLSYFDVKNFTDRIECPVYMAFGLQDPTCPPHTNFAGYNMVRSEKQYMCVPTCGHGMWEVDAWKEARDKWFKKMN